MVSPSKMDFQKELQGRISYYIVQNFSLHLSFIIDQQNPSVYWFSFAL